MNFSGECNLVLWLLKNSNKEFKKDYEKVVSFLPKELVKAVDNNKDIEYLSDDLCFSVKHYREYGVRQICIDYTNHDCVLESMGLNIVELNNDFLIRLPEYDGFEDAVLPRIFSMNYLVSDVEEYEYTFDLVKLDLENYNIIMKKNIIVDGRVDVTENVEVFEATREDLTGRVKKMIHTR